MPLKDWITTPRVKGLAAPNIDPELDNLLIGSPDRDVIEGKGGDDAIFGRIGRDLLSGDDQTVTLDAESGPIATGNDVLPGGLGMTTCTATLLRCMPTPRPAT